MEEWKALIYGKLDLSDRYEISNTGKLRNRRTKKELKFTIHPTGYKVVVISLGHRHICKLIKIHRAVAYMFVDGYREGLVVNHKDLNKLNNNADNLEWITCKENAYHAMQNSEKSGCVNLPRKIRCIQTQQIFESVNDARRWCGLKRISGIILSAQGKQPHSGKHPITGEKLSWEYVD